MRPRVWAPRAASLDLVTPGSRATMAAAGGGWYEAAAELSAGERYRFSLDGGDPMPDPRSASQPEGVHGWSEVVDHSAFAWSDAGWSAPPLEQLVVYEMHTGTISPEGTFDGAITKLDHLVELGVTAVEIMPVASFPGRQGWGYDGVAMYAPHHPYGGPDGLKRLVDACHRRGLAVFIDVVYNHLGPDGNYLGNYGPYFTDRFSTPWGDAVNYDGAGSDEVRRFAIDNALMWLRDYHADGLRLDAVHAILDTSAMHLLEELGAEVHTLAEALRRPLFVVAESDQNDPRLVRDRAVGGFGMNAQWSDDLHHALHAVLTGERNGYYADFGDIAMLGRAFERAFAYDGLYSRFRERRQGRPALGLPQTRFLGYSQTHDQVGNRARGDRLSMLVSQDLLRIAAAIVLTGPFTPMLFQGEEWAASTPFLYFTNHQDAELGEAVSRGRAREFGAFGWDPDQVPDPQDPATYRASMLDWDELSQPPHQQMLDWYRALLRLRRDLPVAGDVGSTQTAVYEAERCLVVEREGVGLACNFSDSTAGLPEPSGGFGEVLLASGQAADIRNGSLVLPPLSVTVWRPAARKARR